VRDERRETRDGVADGHWSGYRTAEDGSYKLSSRTSWIACHLGQPRWARPSLCCSGYSRADTAWKSLDPVKPTIGKAPWRGAIGLPTSPQRLLPGLLRQGSIRDCGTVSRDLSSRRYPENQNQRTLGRLGGLRRAVVCGAKGADKPKNHIFISSTPYYYLIPRLSVFPFGRKASAIAPEDSCQNKQLQTS